MLHRTPLRIATALTACALTLTTLAACQQFTPPGSVDSPSPADATVPTPIPTCNNFGFESVFSSFGSVHHTLVLAPGLTLQLDMWTEQKTHEWFADTDKKLSYTVHAIDSHADEDDPFTERRRVYLDDVSVQAHTVQTGGTSTIAYQMHDDATELTLDPEALQSKKRGLLITSPKGGFQYEKTEIGQVPDDTYGLTMDFELEVSAEKSKGSSKYSTDEYEIIIPIAIFSPSTANASTSCATNATLAPSYAP